MSSYWVDHSLQTNGHTGTWLDPFSFSDLQTHSNANPTGNIYYRKGNIEISGDVALNIRGNKWYGWINSDTPYDDIDGVPVARFDENCGIKSTGAISFSSNSDEYPQLTNTYLYSSYVGTGTITIDLQGVFAVVNCIFRTEYSSTIRLHEPSGGGAVNGYYGGNSFYGLIIDNGIYELTDVVDCFVYGIYLVSTPSFGDDYLHFINCGIYDSSFTININGYSMTDCGDPWRSGYLGVDMPGPPDFDGVQAAFEHRFLAAGLIAPPESGRKGGGSDKYVLTCGILNYSYALWGTPRRGIGAVYFPVLDVDFSADSTSINTNEEVAFTTSCDWAESNVTAYDWNFGDGGKSFEENPSHIYKKPGTYTVSLTIYVDPYDYSLDDDGAPSPLSTSETKIDYITVSQSEKELEDKCLRFATENNEGVGWSEYENYYDASGTLTDGFIRPIDGGLLIVNDENSNNRCLIHHNYSNNYGIDYEFLTYDKFVFLKPCFTDGADFDGENGHEIYTEKWGHEQTAGDGDKNQTIRDEKSWLTVHPTDPDNRSKTGYTEYGMRDSQEFGIDVYVDEEKLIPGARVTDIPREGEIRFPGVEVEGRKIQYVIKSVTSEFRMTEIKHLLINKDQVSSTVEKTMTEYDHQLYYVTDLLLHISRGRFLYDLISKELATGTAEKCDGPDEYSDSAIQGSGEILLPDMSGSGQIDVLFMAPNTVSDPDINFDVSGGSGLFSISEHSVVCENVISGWNIFLGTYTGTLPSGLSIIASSYPFKIFDLRIFKKTTPETGWGTTRLAAVKSYYRDVANNKGNAFLPRYISL